MNVLNSTKIRLAAAVLLVLVISLGGWQILRKSVAGVSDQESTTWTPDAEIATNADNATEEQRALIKSEVLVGQITCLTTSLSSLRAQSLNSSEGDNGLINTMIFRLEDKVNYLEVLNYYLSEGEITLANYQREYQKCKDILNAPELREFPINSADCLN